MMEAVRVPPFERFYEEQKRPVLAQLRGIGECAPHFFRRVVELSRMLSGQPGSQTARDHATELLEGAARQRGGDR